MSKKKDEGKENILIDSIINRIMEALSKYSEVILEDVTIDVDEMEIIVQPMVQQVLVPAIEKIAEKAIPQIARISFEEPHVEEFNGKIVEVKIGATRSEGGTRDRVLIVGGETLPAFFYLSGKAVMPHPPVLTGDVFDMKISLPRAVRLHFEDVLEDPIAWAKKWVDKYGAEMITIHMISTDPSIKDTPPREAAKLIENILQAVKIPIAVGGSGNVKKDVEVFKAIADVAEGERILINSLNLDMDLTDIGKYLKNKDCVVIDFSPMDLDKAREINRKMYDYLPKERIVNDLNIAGPGYGLEYGFTAIERARLAALRGDTELQHPIIVAASNALGAREAWMKMDDYWGPREIRTVVWEVVTGVVGLLAGADILFVANPTSYQILKEIIDYLVSAHAPKPEEIFDWVSIKF